VQKRRARSIGVAVALIATATTGLLPGDPVEAHPRRPECETRNNNT